jgi:GT2 family glycosyltransferase
MQKRRRYPADVERSEPRVSSIGVIVPAYNAERWVLRSLSTLQAQTVSTWQCVVVDDGSTDQTAAMVAAVAATDSRIRLVRQPNQGLAAARNAGLRELGDSVDLLMFLDSDDLLVPDAMELLLDELATRPDAVGAFGLAEYMDVDEKPVLPGAHPARQRARRVTAGLRYHPISPGADTTFADMALYGPIWPPAVALHRRAVVGAVGGFDNSLRMIEDWDLYLRMSRRGPFVMVDRQVAWYRRHDSNVSNDVVKSSFVYAGVVRKAWLDPANTAEQRHVMAVGYRRLRADQLVMVGRVMLGAAKRGNWRGTLRSGAALCWQAAILLRAAPPLPSRRRVAWSLGLPASAAAETVVSKPGRVDPILGHRV